MATGAEGRILTGFEQPGSNPGANNYGGDQYDKNSTLVEKPFAKTFSFHWKPPDSMFTAFMYKRICTHFPAIYTLILQ